MGIYVNPGNTAFCKALNSEIYIDKTDLMGYITYDAQKGEAFMPNHCLSVDVGKVNINRQTFSEFHHGTAL